MNAVPAWNNATIFAVLIGIVAFSMFMGSRSRSGQTQRSGWWVGLVVLLVILSAFFGFTSFRMRSVVEERYASRPPVAQVVADARDELEAGLREAQENVDDAVKDMQRTLKNALGNNDKNLSRPRAASSPPRVTASAAPPSVPSGPRVPKLFEVKLSDAERSTKKDDVERRIKDRAADRVADWVNEALPRRVDLHHLISPELLEHRGAFPEPVQFTEQKVDQFGLNNTQWTDIVYGGKLKVLLTTETQDYLMSLGYEQVDLRLRDGKFLQQGIVFALLMCGALGATGLGLLCSAHRWWSTRPTVAPAAT